jgi:hypothetical protein
MYKVKEKVRELSTPDYDINVWADNEGDMDASWTVNLTFYWLKYPGDPDYPDNGHGFPLLTRGGITLSRFRSCTVVTV